MGRRIDLIGLDELELTNNELFVRKSVSEMNVNSRIIVEETHNAILIKNGRLLDTLKAGDYPIFDKKIGIFSNEKIGSFRVDLIYISSTAKLRVLWGTRDLIDFRDPLTDIPIKLGASGEFEFRVKNPRKFFLELIGADKAFTVDELKTRLQGRIISEIEPAIAQIMRDKTLSYCTIAEHKQTVAAGVLPKLQNLFETEYGLEMTSFILSRVVLSEEDKNAIEGELERRKTEKLLEEEEAKRKQEIKEIAEELERLKDKEFERELMLRNLEKDDYEKYLEVCKVIGWQVLSDKTESDKRGNFCPNCGNNYEEGAKFCGMCGFNLENRKKKCDACGAENDIVNKFCSACGSKL